MTAELFTYCMAGERTSPLERLDGFNEEWWNSWDMPLHKYHHELRVNGVPVCRASVSHPAYDPASQYTPRPIFPRGPALFELIETREGHRHQGHAKELIKRVVEYHAPLRLGGFSEADEFWTHMGWDPHYNQEEPNTQTFMAAPIPGPYE